VFLGQPSDTKPTVVGLFEIERLFISNRVSYLSFVSYGHFPKKIFCKKIFNFIEKMFLPPIKEALKQRNNDRTNHREWG